MITCPNCHQSIKSIDYFCANCGKKLRNKPLSTSLSTQVILYIKTLLLPPMGIIWGIRYLRQSDSVSKWVGFIAIVITIIEIIWITQSTISIINFTNQQVSQQMNLYGL